MVKGSIKRGTQGMVFKAKKTSTGEFFAIKRIPESQVAMKEYGVLMRLHAHSNIVSCIETFTDEDPESGEFRFNLVMELCEGTLKDAPPDLSERRQLITQLTAALAYIHDKGFIHGDLKPANVLLQSGCVRLCDFS